MEPSQINILVLKTQNESQKQASYEYWLCSSDFKNELRIHIFAELGYFCIFEKRPEHSQYHYLTWNNAFMPLFSPILNFLAGSTYFPVLIVPPTSTWSADIWYNLSIKNNANHQNIHRWGTLIYSPLSYISLRNVFNVL